MRIRALCLFCSCLSFLAAWLPPGVAAQQSEQRSEVELLPVGPPKEITPRPWGLYDFHTELEIGYQQANIHGNNVIYRSTLNYSDGFRVFGFRWQGRARDSGAFFTRMYMEGSGWGGDPYNWMRYGLSKDRWFDFKADYLRSDYFFFYPDVARGEHFNDQQRRRQSYELTLFPQRPLRIRLAYRRNSSFGPTLTTFDFSRDEFVLFEPLRQTYDEYLIGADWNIQRWSFFFDYSYRFQRNDRFLTLVTPPVPNEGNTVPPNTSFLNEVGRAYPGRGRIPVVRLTVAGRPHHSLDVSARIVYSRAKFEYTRFEFQDGRTFDPSGAPPAVLITNTITSVGEIIRPNTLADIGIVWRPTLFEGHLSISESFRFNGFDISGGDLTNIFTTCSAPTQATACDPGFLGERPFNLFDVDYYVNRIEARYEFTRWLGARVGHRHYHRNTVLHQTLVECLDATLPDCIGGTLTVEDEQESATRVANQLLLGGDFRPHRTFSAFVDFERGGIDSVFNRIRTGRRTNTRVRLRWQPAEGIRLSATWVQFDLRAPSPDVDSKQHNRGFTLDFALTRWQRFYWDIGYARNDVSSFTDIGRRLATGFRLVDGPTGIDCTLVGGVWLRNVALELPCRPSTYIDNNNYAYFDLGGRLVRNLYGEIGYRVFFATGTYLPSDPEGNCPLVFFGPCNNYPLDPVTGQTQRIEWGGLNYHQPHALLRYVFSDRVSWKGGWRWYGYNVKQGTLSDFKAHIVTTSLVLNW